VKKLYTFTVEIENKKSVEVFVAKPSQSEIEDAEFIYAQKFNQLLQDGFLSKAMMNKKFGDIGGIFSEKSNKELAEAITELLEAKKRIEFYGNAKNLTPSQQQELDKANETHAILQKKIVEGDQALQSMFSKSADSKAEEHMVKWFILNSSYYIAEIQDGDVKKSQEFKLFDKPSFAEKAEQLNSLFEDIEEYDSDQVKLKKHLIAKSFVLIGRIISIWYNGYGADQDAVQKALEEFFPEDFIKEEKPVVKKRAKKA
jgi:hypothetical protein